MGASTYKEHKGGLIAVYNGTYNENASLYFNEMSDFASGAYSNNIILKADIEKVVSIVDHYEIYKDETHIGNTTSTNYTDNNVLTNPSQYTVYAVNDNQCTGNNIC